MSVAATFALVAAVLQALALLMLAHLHRIDRSPGVLTRAVSDMALDPMTARIFVVYGSLGTLAILCLACAVALSDRVALPARAPVYMALLGLLRIGVLAFPTDAPGAQKTRTGHVHLFFAVVTFSLAYMAIAASAPVVAALPGAIGPFLGGLRWIVAAALAGVVVTMAPPLHGLFGIPERIFLVGAALWFLLLGLLLATGG
jgi:hypothetical protein